jgi:uncharacterized protein (TIGR03435 family)
MAAASQTGLAAAKAMLANRSKGEFTEFFAMAAATVPEFVERLSPYLDHSIIDQTQLEGHYRFTLNWVADGVTQKEGIPQGPSIFAALEEQLGLGLQSATDRLQVLVIDSAERTPAGN